MIEIAENVFQIPLFPRQAINAYLLGAVVVDAGVRSSAAALQKTLTHHDLSAHVLTHAHADHQGASAFLCDHFHLPFWCGVAAQEPARTGAVTDEYPNPRHPVARLQQRFWAGPGVEAQRTLCEGDMIEDFRVLETPGHSRGHLAFWRERDGVLIAGDVLVNMDMLTTRPGLHEPPTLYTHNIAQNRQSIRKLAALNPRLIAFGHGPVLRNLDPLLELVAKLP